MAGSFPGIMAAKSASAIFRVHTGFRVPARLRDGAGLVLDDRVPVAAARAGDGELENHIHTGGRSGLKVDGHVVENGLPCRAAAASHRRHPPVPGGRRGHEVHQGAVGVPQLLGPVQAVDGSKLSASITVRGLPIAFELDAGARQHRRPVVIPHAGIEDLAGGFALFAAEVEHHGRHEFGFHLLEADPAAGCLR
jgi:hypothetical protein